MKITRTVSVTNDNITNGDPLSPKTCPIALALIDAGFANVSVGARSASGYIVRNGFFSKFLPKVYVVGDLPSEVSQLIRNFDSGKPVQPLVFPWSGHSS